MNDYLLSLIRTWVPVGIAWAITQLAIRWDIVLDEDTSRQAATVSVAVVAALYYGIVRALEKRWPKVGILLGAARKPVYVAPRRFP